MNSKTFSDRRRKLEAEVDGSCRDLGDVIIEAVTEIDERLANTPAS